MKIYQNKYNADLVLLQESRCLDILGNFSETWIIYFNNRHSFILTKQIEEVKFILKTYKYFGRL